MRTPGTSSPLPLPDSDIISFLQAYLVSIGYEENHRSWIAYVGHIGFDADAAEEYAGLTIVAE